MSGLMSLVLYSLKRSYPASIKGIAEWSAALLLVFVGTVLATGHGKLPEFISVSIARFLIVSGLYLAYVGTQRFFGVTPRVWPWMTLITGVALIQLWFTFVEPSYHARLVLANMLAGYLFAVHAFLVFKQGSPTFARVLTLGVLVAMSVIQWMRLVTSFIWPVGQDIFETAPHHVVYVTSFVFCILLLSISMVLMATERLRTELEHLAMHDSLTNALTRRHMNEACHQELERSRRHGRSMALLIMDLDHFKSINDSYGHQAGDRVLVNFVARVNALLRRPDQLGRFGGEEFVALLPDTSLDEALVVAERIRATCALTDHTPSCTVSIGVTTNRLDNDSVDTLLTRADVALYRAKARGRNRVETA
ncbi:MAG: diguanylate cyclase [Rhodoferax sp.]|nr:diguanylate cyclase [Rhodoferax sp.]